MNSEAADEVRRRRLLFLVFSAATLPVFLFFGFLHQGLSEFLIAAAVLGGALLVYFRPRLAEGVYLLLSLAVMVHLLQNLLTPEVGPDSFLWLLLIPLFVLTLFGYRRGGWLLGIFFLVFSLWAWVPNPSLLDDYSAPYKLRFSAIFLLISLFAYLMEYSRSRSLARQNLANERLALLLREIHHRLKNNLGMINGIIELKRLDIEDPRARELLDEIRDKILAVGMIHDNLYRGEDLAGLDLREYAVKLARVVAEDLQDQPLEVENRLVSQRLDIDRALTVGLIVTELVTNAVKHGFSGSERPRDGRILLEGERSGENYVLRILNNGSPAQADFSFESGDSLGMRMVRSFAEEIDGSIRIVSRNPVGIELLFPVR